MANRCEDSQWAYFSNPSLGAELDEFGFVNFKIFRMEDWLKEMDSLEFTIRGIYLTQPATTYCVTVCLGALLAGFFLAGLSSFSVGKRTIKDFFGANHSVYYGEMWLGYAIQTCSAKNKSTVTPGHFNVADLGGNLSQMSTKHNILG